MNRKGMDFSMLIKILIWLVIIALVIILIRKYVLGLGGDVVQPGITLLESQT